MNDGKDTARAAQAGEEADFRAVLALASDPPPAEGAMARLMARIEREPQETAVVAFAPRAAAPRRRGLLWRTAAALPLAASLALVRQGFDVTVLEQAPEIGEIGAGIQLGPNAFSAFDALGVGEKARGRAVYVDEMIMHDAIDGVGEIALTIGQPE